MALAKYYEDIVRRYIESDFGVDAPTAPDVTQPSVVKPQLRYCPLCFSGFLEERALDNHIAGKHGKEHVYLKVNDQIVRDVCWTKHPIKECRLVILEIESVEVSIHVKSHTTRFRISESSSLLEHIPSKQVEGVISIEAHGGPFDRSFTLYQGRQPAFRADGLDEIVRKVMGTPYQVGEIDLIDFRDDCLRLRLNDLETRYLNGIVEYCHGFGLEIEGKGALARHRLESAMDLLMPFCTPIAEYLRHALALRMNCFTGQWGCSEDSAFRIAERFFCLEHPNGVTTRSSTSTSEPCIWIDPISSQILQALRAFDANDDRGVFSILNSINVRDRNDEDKMILIEARTKARMGDLRGALTAYDKFVEHPIFGGEADRYKNEHSA